MTDFWSWPGWAGVQGVASVVGVVAVVTAVIDFLASQQSRLDEVARMRITQARSLEDHDIEKVTVTLRTTGPQPLYEAQWRVWGRDWSLPELPSVVVAGQVVAPLEFTIRREDRAKVKVGVVYLVPRRWTPHVAGLRRAVDPDTIPEIYRMRRWPWWPFKHASRWVTPRRRVRYQRRFLWIPDDE